jgi:HEAT repeat protein
MFLRFIHSTRLSAVVVLTLCLTGCAASGRKWYDPFGLWTKKEEEPKKKVVTNADRIKILRDLAKQASTMQIDEQTRATDELCLAIPKEQDILVRSEMLRTIAMFPSPRAEAMLRGGLRDADQDVRIACCDAWASRGGSEANHVLCEMLTSDTDTDVRLAAARALGKLKDPQSVPALTLALDDSNPAIQFRAMSSLKAVTGKNFETVKEWKEFSQGNEPDMPSIAERLRHLF